MSYSCKILLDSISETNKRLTTMEITFPRIVLAEFNTHRMFSRNSASSRAIPFKTQLKRVEENTFVPEQFPVNEKGMQPKYYITKENNSALYQELYWRWLYARDKAMQSARDIYNGIDLAYPNKVIPDEYLDPNGQCKNIHKQIVNRLLEPFMWHTVIVTATEWDNFFKLRCDENTQYEIRRIADLMYEAYHEGMNTISSSTELTGTTLAPEIQKLKIGEWHCPLVSEEDYVAIDKLVDEELEGTAGEYDPTFWKLEFRKKISVARCARVSYLTHDGKRDIEKDLDLFERLRTGGHWSPFEHVATPYLVPYNKLAEEYWHDKNYSEGFCDSKGNRRSGNFYGWKQYRKEFQDENCTLFRKEDI